MDATNTALFVSLVGLSVALVKIIEHLIKNWKEKKEPEKRECPPGVVDSLRKAEMCFAQQEIKFDYMHESNRKIEASQEILTSRIGDLISSQQRVCDRINDLILRIDGILSK